MPDADLLLHQRRLMVRSQELRTAMARDVRRLVRPLDRMAVVGSALVNGTRGPVLPLVAAMGLLLAWRLRGGLRMPLRLWGLWRVWRSLRPWLQG